MDEAGFRTYLIRGGRSPSAQKRVTALVREYERFLEEQRGGKRVFFDRNAYSRLPGFVLPEIVFTCSGNPVLRHCRDRNSAPTRKSVLLRARLDTLRK